MSEAKQRNLDMYLVGWHYRQGAGRSFLWHNPEAPINPQQIELWERSIMSTEGEGLEGLCIHSFQRITPPAPEE